MESVSLTIGAPDVQARIRQRLSGLNPTARRVVWRSSTHAVFIYADRIQARRKAMVNEQVILARDLLFQRQPRDQLIMEQEHPAEVGRAERGRWPAPSS